MTDLVLVWELEDPARGLKSVRLSQSVASERFARPRDILSLPPAEISQSASSSTLRCWPLD
jgi:hypothetical protein